MNRHRLSRTRPSTAALPPQPRARARAAGWPACWLAALVMLGSAWAGPRSVGADETNEAGDLPASDQPTAPQEPLAATGEAEPDDSPEPVPAGADAGPPDEPAEPEEPEPAAPADAVDEDEADAPTPAGEGDEAAGGDEPGELDDDPYSAMEPLFRAMELIRQNYVDADQVTYEKLVAGAIEGMAAALDPHSQFMREELLRQMRQEQDETAEGIGVTLSLRGGSVTVVSVREDGPAARAGVLPGDRILRINEVVISRASVPDAGRLLRGAAGESVKIVVRRPGTGELLPFDIVREKLRTSSVVDAMLLPEGLAGGRAIGYVRLLQFNQPTAGELAAALDELHAQGMEALVLDLRNNPGGLLDAAVEVLGEFLPPDTTVVTAEGRAEGQTLPPMRTSAGEAGRDFFPLAVLVNHASASAAEVVAGALQDLRRAVIVGERTFGKGSIQAVIPLEQGGALKLTTARYYTPGRRTIHENGVEPDIVSSLTSEEEARVMAWWRGEGRDGDEAGWALEELGDRPLARAADALVGVLAVAAFTAEAAPATPDPGQAVPAEQETGQPEPAEPPAPADADAADAPDAPEPGEADEPEDAAGGNDADDAGKATDDAGEGGEGDGDGNGEPAAGEGG